MSGPRDGVRQIARLLGRQPSTISRELRRNTGRDGYRASDAHARAYQRASWPKPAKLAGNPRLRGRVEADLQKRYSPEQITGQLRADFPHDPEMQVCPETSCGRVQAPPSPSS